MILREFNYKGFRVTKHSYFGWGYYDEDLQCWKNGWNYIGLKRHLNILIDKWIESLPEETHSKIYHTKKL